MINFLVFLFQFSIDVKDALYRIVYNVALLRSVKHVINKIILLYHLMVPAATVLTLAAVTDTLFLSILTHLTQKLTVQLFVETVLSATSKNVMTETQSMVMVVPPNVQSKKPGPVHQIPLRLAVLLKMQSFLFPSLKS